MLNVILRCTKCGVLVDAEDYSAYLQRIHAVRFPLPVVPFRCEECRC